MEMVLRFFFVVINDAERNIRSPRTFLLENKKAIVEIASEWAQNANNSYY